MKSIILRLTTLGYVGFVVLSCSGNESAKFKVTIGTTQATLIPATTQSCKEQLVGTVDNTKSIGKSYFSLFNPTFEWNGDSDFTVSLIAVVVKMDSPFVGGKYQCIITDEDLDYLYYNNHTSSSTGIVQPISFWNHLSLQKVDTGSRTADGKDIIYFLKNTSYWTTELDSDGDGTIDAYVPDSYVVVNGAITAAPNVSAPVLYTRTSDRFSLGAYQNCPIRCGGVQSQEGARFTTPVSVEVTAVAVKTNSDGTRTEVPYKATASASVQQLF